MEHHWHYEKILTLEQAAAKASELKTSGKKIATLNGSFDILHAGHLDMLEEAKGQCDVLFVGLNSDRSVREGKGQDRPFIPEQERAALLAALQCVDYVVLIDELYDEVPRVLLRKVQPHVHVNGSEYGQPEQWIEWVTMKEVGTLPHVVERRSGLATSDIIRRIRSM